MYSPGMDSEFLLKREDDGYSVISSFSERIKLSFLRTT
jgi:hypothetical protein